MVNFISIKTTDKKKEGSRRVRVRGDVRTEAEAREKETLENATLLALNMERGPGAKQCRQPPETGKGKETVSLKASRKNTALLTPCILGLLTSRTVR